jgi:hypothetical protein
MSLGKAAPHPPCTREVSVTNAPSDLSSRDQLLLPEQIFKSNR